jgi:PAS domain S-box-containing protein
MAVVLVSAVAAFVLALVTARVLRRRIIDEDLLRDGLTGQSTSFPYSAVIQELKQQKFSLQNEHQIERRRARLSEHITSAVISNLPCGILFLAPNGLVRQANTAARQILGFASPVGMSVEKIFAEAQAVGESSTHTVREVFSNALRGEAPTSDFEISYSTPAGQLRVLNLAIIILRATHGEELGLASVIRDVTAEAELRKAEVLRRERAAELALDLRTSLSTIRGYMEQVCATNDTSTKSLAKVIASETERLERVVGGFLVENRGEQAFAAHG